MSEADELNEALDAFRRGDLERARALAEAAASSRPSARSHHLLGLIHCRQGNPEAGVEWLTRACDDEPGNLGYRVMAARALVDAGRASEVLAMPQPPPITSASAMAAWQVRGEAADAAGDASTSELVWRTICRAVPADWRALSNLGNTLARQQRWEEAAEALQRAVSLQPGEAGLWRNLGSALASAERHAEALKAADEWGRSAGPSAEQAMLRGQSLAALNRFDEAEMAYRTALEFGRDNPIPWQALGLAYERTGQSVRLAELIDSAAAAGVLPEQLGYVPAIAAMEEGRLEDAGALLDASGPEQDPLQWYRLKSRIAERMGRYSEAFDAAAAMNASTKHFDTWVRRGSEYRARLRRIKVQPSVDSLPAADRTPVFLVGFPRSGTTLLDTFLMGHPDVAVLEELPLITAAEEICPVAQAGTCSAATLTRARRAYFDGLAGHVDPAFDGMIVDKMPLNMLAVPLIQRLFPGARFIFAQRHPYDAVLSGFMQSFVATEPMASFLTIEGAADFYDAAMTLWTQSIEVLRIDCHTVTYEKLVQSPQSVLTPLFEFLGLEWAERVLDHQRTANARGAVVTPSYNQITEALSSRAVARWRNYREQLEPVLPIVRPWADRLGYTSD